METIKQEAVVKDILVEQQAYVSNRFKVTGMDEGESLIDKNIKFTLSSEKGGSRMLIKDQDSMSVGDDTVSVLLTSEETDHTGKHWYELWIEFESNQWTKQFKGEYKFTKSTAYNDAP